MDIHAVALAKGPERYVILYDDNNRAKAMRQLGRWASNPELSFMWADASKLSGKIADRVEQHRRFDCG